MSSMLAPHFAAKDSPESLAAESLLAVRKLFVSLPQPPGPIAEAFRAARAAMKAWLKWHGSPIVAGGRLWYLDDEDALDDFSRPVFPTRMARRGDQNGQSREAETERPTPKPKPKPSPSSPLYIAPAVVAEGDLKATARTIEGRAVWSVKILDAVLGPGVRTAMAAVRDATPATSHNAMFPVYRARVNGRTSPVTCVSAEGLKALARHFPPKSRAERALRKYLGG